MPYVGNRIHSHKACNPRKEEFFIGLWKQWVHRFCKGIGFLRLAIPKTLESRLSTDALVFLTSLTEGFMIEKHRLVIVLILLAMVTGSCRRAINLADWETDLLVPVAEGELNLVDLVKANELISDDSNLLRVQLNDTLINLGLDSLISIPDTSFQESFILPFGNAALQPGVPFYDTSTVTRYNLQSIQLTYLEVRSSLFTVEMENLTGTQILIEYTIPSATDENGDTFKLARLIPANSELEENFDLNGYRLNLRGRRNASYNTMISSVKVMVDPALSAPYTLRAGEGFRVKNTFKRIVPQYARGYFGSVNSNASASEAFDLLTAVSYDRIDITEFNVKMIIDNGVGADLGLTIEELGSVNQGNATTALLAHPIIGSKQLLSRAIFLGENMDPPVKHIQKSYEFNEDNSNLDALIEVNPTHLFYDVNIDINPLGNITLGNDFVFFGHNLSAVMQVDIPIKLGVEGLVLTDTFDFLFEEPNPEEGSGLINSGYLNLYLINGYPLGAEIALEVLNEQSEVIGELAPGGSSIGAAHVNSIGKVIQPISSVIKMPVDQAKIAMLKEGRMIKMTARLSSTDGGIIHLYDNHVIKFSLVADFNVNTP